MTITLARPEVRFTDNGRGRGREFQSLFQSFAETVDRTVVVTAPHGSPGMGTDHVRGHLRDHSHLTDPLLLVFFDVPKLTRFPRRRSGTGRITCEGGSMLTQAQDYRGIDELPDGRVVTTMPPEEIMGEVMSDLTDYGDAIGSMFLGNVDLSWIDEISTVARQPLGSHRLLLPERWGWAFADALFIPYDMVHVSEDEDDTTYRPAPYIEALLDRMVSLYGPPELRNASDEERIEVLTRRRAEREEQRRREVIERATRSIRPWLSGMVSVRQEQLVREHQAAMSHVESYRAALTNYIRQTDSLNLQLNMLAEQTGQVSDTDLEALREMLEKGVLTDFSVDGQRMTFTTWPLYAYDDRTGALHEIGRIRCTVDMITTSLSYENLDRRVTGYSGRNGNPAPHVDAGGIPCLGSFSEILVDLLSRQDWLSFISASIAFIESANTNDIAGRRVNRWPFVEHPEDLGRGYPPYPEGQDVRPLYERGYTDDWWPEHADGEEED